MNLKIIFFIYTIIITTLGSYLYTKQTALNEKLLTSQIELTKQIEVNKYQIEIISNLERKLNILKTDSSIITCEFNSFEKTENINKILIEQSSSSEVLTYLAVLGAAILVGLIIYYISTNNFNIVNPINPDLPAPIIPEILNNKLDFIIDKTEEINIKVTNIENIIIEQIGNLNNLPIENVQNLPNNDAMVLHNSFNMHAVGLIAGFANNLGNF
jgi:hypothetical protein